MSATDDDDPFGELPYTAGEILPDKPSAALASGAAAAKPDEPRAVEPEPAAPAPLSVVPLSDAADAAHHETEPPPPPPPPAEPSPPAVVARTAPGARIDAVDDRELHGGRLTGDRVRLGNPIAGEVPAPTGGSRGLVIAAASAKGGVGKTTLAVVTATQIAHTYPDLSVALVDCEPDFGMIAPALQIGFGSPTLGDALHGTPVQEIGITTDDEITVYAAPEEVGDLHALLSHPDRLRSLIDEIAALHDIVIIDLGGGLAGDLNATLLRGVHALLLVSEPRLQTTMALLRAVDRLRDTDGLRDRGLTVVINQVITDQQAAGYEDTQNRLATIMQVANRHGQLLPLLVPHDRALADALDDGDWVLANTQPETRTAIESVVRSLMSTLRP